MLNIPAEYDTDNSSAKYVFQEKTIYIVLTGTVIYIVAKQLRQWQSVSLETNY
jgi:hypothetical protein